MSSFARRLCRCATLRQSRSRRRTEHPAGRHAHPQRLSFAKRVADDRASTPDFLPRGRDTGRRRLDAPRDHRQQQQRRL